MTAPALILFAHGARDPEWALPMHRVRDAILARSPGSRVELAFLELMAPGLEPCVDGLVGEGVRHIAVVPLFIAQGGHLKRDLPLLLDALRARHPGLRLDLAPPVGEAPAVVAAMAGHALAQLDAIPGIVPAS